MVIGITAVLVSMALETAAVYTGNPSECQATGLKFIAKKKPSPYHVAFEQF